MDWKSGRQLEDGMRPNPVVYAEHVDLDALGIPIPDEADLLKVFKTAGYSLQTWNRSKDQNGKTILVNDPHWIGVRRGTPLHVDPKYPRYTHHLKVRVDPGIFARGYDGEEIELRRGLFYILDTHSPHQVFSKAEGAWNVSASIDHKIQLNPASTLARLIEYARTTHILAGVDLE